MVTNLVIHESSKIELVLTRIYHAPRALLFKAWTDSRLLSKWWGPKDFTNPICIIDPYRGGLLFINMTAPDGTQYPTNGVIHEISPPDRLVFATTGFEDEIGRPLLQVLNTVSFAGLKRKTKLTLHVVVVKAGPEIKFALDGMDEGWNQSLDRLGNQVESK
ncbi:MAG: SRPBCC domain-containing protein [Bacteroidetes bacterium]|nr:MAG: SRPBCC domain-containing protein [Bacteroidota bacterium]